MSTNDNKTTSENSKYVIWNTYVESLSINCIEDVRDFFTDDRTCKIGVDSIKTQIVAKEYCNRSFLVEITIDLVTLEKSTMALAHSLVLELVSTVSIEDTIRSKNVVKAILRKIVPSNLFERIATIISNTLMSSAGYSLKISKTKFMNSIQEVEMKDIKEDDDVNLDSDNHDDVIDSVDEEDNAIIDYQYILRKMSNLAEAREFLATYQKCVGPDGVNNYVTTNPFKFYYRFFLPIKYHHPNITRCDESVWPMFFQLLFGDFDVTCRIIDRGDDCPEIEFAYENHSRLVSELSESDFKELLEELVTDMLTKVGVELIGYKYIDNEYGETINQNRLIRKKEFFKLYGYDDGDSFLSNEFLENMYSRIKDCDIKTLIYRK